MKSRFLLFMLLGIPGMLLAQEKQGSFSIREAQEYALENNKTYKNAIADVKLAKAQIREALGAGLPKVEGTVDYMTNFGYEFEFNLGGSDVDPPVIDYSKMDLGDLEVLKILEGMSGPGGSTIKMTDQASANLQVSQLIFSGQFWVGLEIVKIAKVLIEKGLTLTALEIKEQVINSYYLILITEQLGKVISENKANLNEIFKHTNNMYEAGMAEKTDVDQMRINISQLENSERAMNRNLQLNYNMFRMLLGMEADVEVELTENLDGILAEVESNMLSTTELEIYNNPNYQLLRTQSKLGEEQVRLQKWAYAPTLIGFYNYKEKIMASAFDLSPNHAAGFTMSIPIFAGGTKKAQMSQARIQLEKANRNVTLMEEQIALQNSQLSFNLTNAYENYQTQKENVEIAKEVIASLQNKYQQGVISSLDLTQANANYLQAENNYVGSVLELLKSKLALDKLYNNL